MNTADLIKFVATDLLDDRKELVSGESDELFSDAAIARYLAEGERILTRRAWALEDSTSPVARIQLVQGKGEYKLDKSILFVKAIRLSDSDIDIARVGYNDNPPRGQFAGTDTWDVNFAYTESLGRPTRFSTDMGQRVVRVRQKPDAAAAALKLYLTVVRMPVTPISEKLPDNSPEVPEEYHMALASYAAGRCLVRPTVESELRTLGKSYLTDFSSAVLEAKRDRQRLQQSEPQHRFGAWSPEVE
jgi:hypothetical protein